MTDLFNSGIRPQIDQWLLDKAKEKRDYGEYWSASSAGYCQRKVIFERLGVPKVESEDDARKQRVFTAGHLFHDWIQGITKQAGLSIASEVELQDEELMIRGHFDDLVLVPQQHGVSVIEVTDGQAKTTATNAPLILYDYKTANSRSFDYKKEEMSHYHKMQLGTYMYMWRNSYPNVAMDYRKDLPTMLPDLTEARILTIEKDTLRMKEQQLMWSEELELNVVGYWMALNRYWKDKKMPPCTCDKWENGFLAKEKWNGYFYNGEPCSLDWYNKCKKEGLLK